MREVRLEKNVELKCMKVNVLKRVTRITKRGGGIQNDLIGRQCLNPLGMCHGCSGWEGGYKIGRQVVLT